MAKCSTAVGEWIVLMVMAAFVRDASLEMAADSTSGNQDKVAKAARCRKDDPELDSCLQRALQASLPLLLQGNPERGLPPLQPLHVDKLDFGNAGAGLKLKLKDVLISGIANSSFHGLRANLDDYTVNVEGKSPLVSMSGKYKLKFDLDGKEIQGKGKFQMNFTDLESSNILHGVRDVRDGHHIVDVHLDGDIRRVGKISVNFEGLFKGDKEKGEEANKQMNDKWARLWAALEPSLDAAYARLLSEISSKALASLPLTAVFDDI